ncbi:MAG: alpha/beta hydrolase [Actinomycetia bacterium]|nr:alpha/beta hydrolase [Actinomycetes bacterium]MCP4222262.1 alpha/beta hydrolase [Actinomycetes bacterium]MCP5033226.1 alpha/beta hydrolase [Actinomycetes bacterium]
MPTSKPTVVLVHGAWHDERCWADVMSQLSLRRTPSVCLTLPSTDPGRELPGFADDVAAVTDLIDAVDGEVTLCGHSYGGMVISEAGNHDRVTRLVYLAAYCPRPGERVVDQSAGIVSPLAVPAVRQTGDGRMMIRARPAARRLYGDLRGPVASRKAAQLLPSTAAIYRAPATNPAWRSTPTTYVVCRRDRALNSRRSRDTAHRIVRSQLALGLNSSRAVSINTGHSPFYSAPNLVADVLVRSAR